MRRALIGCLVALAVAPGGATAKTLHATIETLAAVLASASRRDTVDLAPGVYPAPLVIDHTLSIAGRPGVVIDGHGQGRVVEVRAEGVHLSGMTIRNSGIDMEKMDAGVFLDQTAKGAVIEDLRLEDNLIGIHVWGADNSVIRHNVIFGRHDLRTNEAGNSIHVWNAPGTRVEDNDIRMGRDGIFVTNSRKNLFRGNVFHGVRFAIHYMYTNDSEVSGNRSYGNDIGLALMYSNRLIVRGNRSEGDREQGLLVNDVNHSVIEDNAVVHGGQKCVFIYNANFNSLRRNWFEGCEIGVHFTAGSEQNAIAENAFINNRNQVKYVGTRALDWSDHGRGNYWSDNPAFDLNGDGIADIAYRPNDLVDRVVWINPAAKLLLNSPAVAALRWAQAQFPALHPGGVIDSAPLMTPPHVSAADAETAP